jgi:hypothetical protein
LTGSTGPTAATVVLGGTPTGTWPISISEIHLIQPIYWCCTCNLSLLTQGTSYQQSVQILEKTRVVVSGVMSAIRLAFHWQSVVAQV